jgi:hypothetical protein
MLERKAVVADLQCESCGQLPEPPRLRFALAGVATVLPIEFLANLFVVRAGLPDMAKVIFVAVSTTILVLWVTEPSVRRLLREWLHGASIRHRRMLHASPSLWRVRVTLPDRSGSLKKITRALSQIDVNIMNMEIHQEPGGRVTDELILGATEETDRATLTSALYSAGALHVSVSRTTPVSVSDPVTRSLGLASKLVQDPTDLPAVLAEMLSAEVLDPLLASTGDYRDDLTIMKVPFLGRTVVTLSRPHEPFTAVESGRAHRLAEIAEAAALGQRAAA